MKKPAFVTLKDHKDNFRSHPKTRLINPTKSELGRVSKQMLDRINADIRAKTKPNQWTNTTDVIDWFVKLPDKNTLTFLVFDIVDFYPSITQELLSTCLNWAKRYTKIKDIEYDTIIHARRTLLYDNNNATWVKRETKQEFDVSMGAYDGAEICELVGLYALFKLKNKINASSIGLYRDDGLATLKKSSGSSADRARKNLIAVFKDLGLKITVETNLKVVDYLDVTFNLTTESYQPYRKPNDTPMYVNAKSNHPPTIIKHIPVTVEKRISSLSSSEEIFKKAAPKYNEALKSCGYNQTIKFSKDDSTKPNKKRKNRSRKIIWFNPPFSSNVKTNIGKTFLTLIGKHFPTKNKLHKIFNKNTVKVSYSCMKNMKSVIKAHNDKIIRKSKQTDLPDKPCNCRVKPECPLRGNCLVQSVVYKATVTHDNTTATYIGLAGGTFKERYRNHTKSFRNNKYEKETELSKYIWDLKKTNIDYKLRWDVVKKSNTGIRKSGQCNLCLEEKFAINMNKDNIINRRSELISKCRHNKSRPKTKLPDRNKKNK